LEDRDLLAGDSLLITRSFLSFAPTVVKVAWLTLVLTFSLFLLRAFEVKREARVFVLV